ncbi:MAG: division/cell wall cluster transcriptional repressor MraZ [Clostridia bacterium]|nr:division/cell wall cluster transcriptional repressor MraZ [Clostridia bacterium]
MLIGEYEHSLDVKGRLIMPSRLREDIGEKFILTKGLDGCLFGFAYKEWEIFEEKLKALPLTNKNARDFTRFFLSGAIECDVDKQGRFLITNNLREYANLGKEVVIVGIGTRIEIWDKEKWEKYNNEKELSADEVAENMNNLGI